MQGDERGGSDSGLRVEFYHDVLCAWCYVLSPRLRRLVEEFPEVQVVHRSFALAPMPDAIEAMFGSREAGKREILQHWRAANLNDDEHRIRAELMEHRPFEYPYSMPGLRACKAAEFQGGQEAHWNYFDRVQRAHLTECRNIVDEDVLVGCAKDVGLSVERFREDMLGEATRRAVLDDVERARRMGITAVPTLVVDGRWMISGAQPYNMIREFVLRIAEEGTPLSSVNPVEDGP